MKRDYFIFRKSYYDKLCEMPFMDMLLMYAAIVKYALTGEEETMQWGTDLQHIFEQEFKPLIDEDREIINKEL